MIRRRTPQARNAVEQDAEAMAVGYRAGLETICRCGHSLDDHDAFGGGCYCVDCWCRQFRRAEGAA